MKQNIKWAITEAFHACRMYFFVAILISWGILAGDGHSIPYSMASLVFLLACCPMLPHFLHYRAIYEITKITSETRGISFEIGHANRFKERWEDNPEPPQGITMHTFGKQHSWVSMTDQGQGFVNFSAAEGFTVDPGVIHFKHCVTYHNGLVIVVENENDIHKVHAILKEEWPFYPLIESKGAIITRMSFTGSLMYEMN